jgi:cytochrome c biogenesis protein CcmG/thiol:disulfide interchange protein DsbE
MLRYLLPLGIFMVLLGFLFKGLYLNPREIKSTLIDKPAPMFVLTQVDTPGKTFTRQDLIGQVTLLNVWASWCVSCREEHPLLMELSRQQAVKLYGLNWKDKLEDAKAWLKRHGNPYLASGHDESGRTGIDYGVTGTPETFVIDKQGVVRYKHVGPITVQVFEQTLWPLLQKLEAEPRINPG